MKWYINFLNKLNFTKNSKIEYFTIRKHKFTESIIPLYLRYGVINFLRYRENLIIVYPNCSNSMRLINKYKCNNTFFIKINNLKNINKRHFNCIVMNDKGFMTNRECLASHKGGKLFMYIMTFV
jgi:ribosomal protein S8